MATMKKEPMSRSLKSLSWQKDCDRRLLIFFTVLVRTESSRKKRLCLKEKKAIANEWSLERIFREWTRGKLCSATNAVGWL